MNLSDADALLAQWGRWCSNELKRLGASKAKWQMDYRPSFDPEHTADDCESDPDELQMLDVDTALAMVKIDTPHHFFVIRGRYVQSQSYSFAQLDAAKRAFIVAYRSPLDDEALTPTKKTLSY